MDLKKIHPIVKEIQLKQNITGNILEIDDLENKEIKDLYEEVTNNLSLTKLNNISTDELLENLQSLSNHMTDTINEFTNQKLNSNLKDIKDLYQYTLENGLLNENNKNEYALNWGKIIQTKFNEDSSIENSSNKVMTYSSTLKFVKEEKEKYGELFVEFLKEKETKELESINLKENNNDFDLEK